MFPGRWSQYHRETLENKWTQVRGISDIETLCSISRHWAQQLCCGFFNDTGQERVRMWHACLQYPTTSCDSTRVVTFFLELFHFLVLKIPLVPARGFGATLVDMVFLLILLPDLPRKLAILWVMQVAVWLALFWAMMLICRVEKNEKICQWEVEDRCCSMGTSVENYYSERHWWTLNVSAKYDHHSRKS